MLAHTYDRIKACKILANPVLIGNQAHITHILNSCEDEGLTWEKILLEPLPRNTAAAFALAAIHIARVHHMDHVLCLLPCDHFIDPPERFSAAITAAHNSARNNGITLLGVTPKDARNNLGYIEAANRDSLSSSVLPRPIIRFHEKPERKKAEQLIQNPQIFWNTGIYLATPRAIYDALNKFSPSLIEILSRAYDSALSSGNSLSLSQDFYQDLPNQSFDRLVMENLQNGSFVFPANFLWHDIGTFEGLAEIKAHQNQSLSA